MTEKQRLFFEYLIVCGRYRSAMIYAAEIMLGPELASRIIR